MTMPDDSAADAEFWEEAGALLHEVMADCKLSQPVRVSLRDVQARIRYRFAQVAATRDAALREARAEILNLKIDLEHERFICTSELEIRDAEIASLRAEIEDWRGRLATSLGETLAARMERDRLQAEIARLNEDSVLQEDLRDMLRALGLYDGARPQSPHEIFRECVSAVARLRAVPSASVVEAARAWNAAMRGYDETANHESNIKLVGTERALRKAVGALDAAAPQREPGDG